MLGTINYTYRDSLRYVYRIYYYRENDNFSTLLGLTYEIEIQASPFTNVDDDFLGKKVYVVRNA